jgi:hypothetical protein
VAAGTPVQDEVGEGIAHESRLYEDGRFDTADAA